MIRVVWVCYGFLGWLGWLFGWWLKAPTADNGGSITLSVHDGSRAGGRGLGDFAACAWTIVFV